MSTVFANDFEQFLMKNKTNNLTYLLTLSSSKPANASVMWQTLCSIMGFGRWDILGQCIKNAKRGNLSEHFELTCEKVTRQKLFQKLFGITFPNKFICADMVYLRLQSLMHFSQSRAIRGLMIHKSMWAHWQLYKHNASRSVSHQNLQLSVPHNTHVNNVMLHICCP